MMIPLVREKEFVNDPVVLLAPMDSTGFSKGPSLTALSPPPLKRTTVIRCIRIRYCFRQHTLCIPRREYNYYHTIVRSTFSTHIDHRQSLSHTTSLTVVMVTIIGNRVEFTKLCARFGLPFGDRLCEIPLVDGGLCDFNPWNPNKSSTVYHKPREYSVYT